MRRLVLPMLLVCAASASYANSQLGPQSLFNGGVQGLILAAEYRFNPAVQRYMAEQSLDAMPLQDGKLYYIFPAHGSNAQLETMQIHNLERLLDRRAAEEKADSEIDP